MVEDWHLKDFEELVNESIKNKNVINIKFTTNNDIYVAMIIYEEKQDEQR